MLSRSSEEIIFSKGVSTNISLIGDDTDPYYRGRTCSVKTFIAGYNKVLKTPSHQTVFSKYRGQVMLGSFCRQRSANTGSQRIY